jgi:hypothetical protein
VLHKVANRLKVHFRTEDTVGRMGGDEFATICQNGTASTAVLLDRVRDALATPYFVSGDLIAATVSIGIATPRRGEDSTQMLERGGQRDVSGQSRSPRPLGLPGRRTNGLGVLSRCTSPHVAGRADAVARQGPLCLRPAAATPPRVSQHPHY